jgi:hypothetical protein
MTEKIIMAALFIVAGFSAMYFYGEGLRMWIWQVTTIVWIINSYRKTKQIERLTRVIKNQSWK